MEILSGANPLSSISLNLIEITMPNFSSYNAPHQFKPQSNKGITIAKREIHYCHRPKNCSTEITQPEAGYLNSPLRSRATELLQSLRSTPGSLIPSQAPYSAPRQLCWHYFFFSFIEKQSSLSRHSISCPATSREHKTSD